MFSHHSLVSCVVIKSFSRKTELFSKENKKEGNKLQFYIYYKYMPKCLYLNLKSFEENYFNKRILLKVGNLILVLSYFYNMNNTLFLHQCSINKYLNWLNRLIKLPFQKPPKGCCDNTQGRPLNQNHNIHTNIVIIILFW